jgi:threonine dehydrogenase-like Zn-dependent dehydrogenase
MQAQTIRYTSNGNIELIEVDVSDPGQGEIQLTDGVCGICSWDIVTCKLGDKMYPMAPPGHEGMGIVSNIGPGVTGFEVGDRVAGGGFATVRNVPADRAYKLPDSDLADELWIVEPVSCVVTGLDHCRLRPGDKVVMIGAGFMGLMLLQGLLHSFAEQVVVLDIAQDRLDLAVQLGAEEVYNLSDVDAPELAAALKARRFDIVVDSTGSQPGLDLAADIVKSGGLINLFGWIKGQRASFDPTKWHVGGFTVVNSAPGSKIRDTFPVAIEMMDSGTIDLEPLVTHVVPLADYPALMKQILAGDSSYVKGVVTLD